MKVALRLARLGQKRVVSNLMQFYWYDFSEIFHSLVGKRGCFGGEGMLEKWWREPGVRFPFLIRVDGRPAGFALVRKCRMISTGEAGMEISEFFVLRGCRRRGVGEKAAVLLFDRFPGKWEVRQIVVNKAGTKFWRKVIRRYTRGRFRQFHLDCRDWKGPAQVFESRGRGG